MRKKLLLAGIAAVLLSGLGLLKADSGESKWSPISDSSGRITNMPACLDRFTGGQVCFKMPPPPAVDGSVPAHHPDLTVVEERK
jgi:hypothetical protein